MLSISDSVIVACDETRRGEYSCANHVGDHHRGGGSPSDHPAEFAVRFEGHGVGRGAGALEISLLLACCRGICRLSRHKTVVVSDKKARMPRTGLLYLAKSRRGDFSDYDIVGNSVAAAIGRYALHVEKREPNRRWKVI